MDVDFCFIVISVFHLVEVNVGMFLCRYVLCGSLVLTSVLSVHRVPCLLPILFNAFVSRWQNSQMFLSQGFSRYFEK